MNSFFATTSLLLCAFTACHRPDFVRVAHQDGLNLRQQPTADSAGLDRIPYGTVVAVEERRDVPQSFNCNSGTQWIRTTFNAKSGWIFAGFVSKADETFSYLTIHGCPVKSNNRHDTVCEEFATQFIQLAARGELTGNTAPAVETHGRGTTYQLPVQCSAKATVLYVAHSGVHFAPMLTCEILEFSDLTSAEKWRANLRTREGIRDPSGSIYVTSAGLVVGHCEAMEFGKANMRSPKADRLLDTLVSSWGNK